MCVTFVMWSVVWLELILLAFAMNTNLKGSVAQVSMAVLKYQYERSCSCCFLLLFLDFLVN